MMVCIMIKIAYLSAIFALLSKNSGACGDKKNKIQVAASSMQTVEQAPLQSSECNFISSSMCPWGSQLAEACHVIPNVSCN